MNETLIALKNMGCRVTLKSQYSWEKEPWICEISWTNDENGDSADFARKASTPEEALNLAREAFERTARRGLPISQIVDHSARPSSNLDDDIPF